MNKYKAVIFDLDGTLADTLGDLTVAMNKMLVSFGWPTKSRTDMIGYIGQGARRFVMMAMPESAYKSEDDRMIDTALDFYSRKYAEAYCNETAAYAGLAGQLAALKNAGYKLGVLSNKQDDFVKNIINKLYPDVFDVVAGHTVFPHKPDPSAAKDVAAKLGVAPEECVFVGDSDIDMKTAVNAGMYPLGVLWGYRGMDVLVSAGAKSMVSAPDALASKIISLGEKPAGLFAKLFGKK